ncbi:MAG TPA: DNA polymerase [Candidatus Paceibacterota bacterium]|jgi:DNA polymerase-1|nr:DNA polymerase [Candidatus Paceibacterota bacterium]
MKKTERKTLVILDAHAIIHRAYHALPSFTDSAGNPTGALYGLASMLIRIIEELAPHYLVAAYDLAAPTFRHHAYEAYKGTRAKTDDELVAQLDRSRDIFSAFGVPCLDAEGFEADDIIGTLVERLKKEKNLSIIIATGDMDTLQLVDDDRVRVFTLKKGVTDTVIYDEKGVEARYGFSPKQLTDFKALRGDPSDNIIGVKGIGEKTATSIVQAFGSIEALYQSLEKNPAAGKKAGLSDRIVELLIEHKDDAFFSKTLATIRRDAPVTYELPTTDHTKALDTHVLMDVMNQYEFRSLIPRVKKLFSIETTPVQVPESDAELFRETQIAFWLLDSEKTTPSLDVILGSTKTTTLADAREIIFKELKKRNLIDLFEKVEKPLIPIVADMTRYGIAIDRDHFLALKKKMTIELAAIEENIANVAGKRINLNSPKQLSELLFDTLGLKAKGKRKESGAFTTNADALVALSDAHPVIPLILKYRETQKLLTTYVEALLGHIKDDGRIHATFFQDGAATGRFSSANPNLQNIPARGEQAKDIRAGFIAGKGNVFVSCDYSQIELRVLAILSGDSGLITIFKNNEDIHSSVAASMFHVSKEQVTADMRRVAKVINFGIIFGMGVSALSKNLGTDRAKAQEFYANYFATFPQVATYLEDIKKRAHDTGYTETLFGRRRYFPTMRSKLPHLRAFAERMASNAPIQGTEADILKIAIVLVDHDIRAAGLAENVHLVLQVHDELVYEVDESVAEKVVGIIERAMDGVFERSPIKIPKLPVELTVATGIGRRLDELK